MQEVKEKNVKRIEERTERDDGEMYLVGFWTDRGTASSEILDLLGNLHGKKVALFGTCGMGNVPEYYDRISSGRTMLFFKEGEENQKQPELAEILRNPNYNFLRYPSLCYLGYDKSSIVFSLYHAVEDEKTVEKKIWMLDNLPNDEFTEECLENILFVNEKKEDEDEQRKELYKEAVRISARNHYQTSLFFFLGRSLRLCLEILAELIEEGAYQYMDTLWRDGWATDADGIYDAFRSCRDREELVNLKDLTVNQFSILIYGLSYTEEFAGVCMEVKALTEKLSEQIWAKASDRAIL